MQLCLGSSTDRLNASIVLISGRHSPTIRPTTQSKHPTQTMAPRHLLVVLPFQALLLLAPADQAHATGTTRFLPEGYRGPACRALKPGCMTKQQWANHCRSTYPMHHPWPKSCQDAISSRSHVYADPGTHFLPDDHEGPTCMALLPACMKRSDWAELCAARKEKGLYNVLPKSCRDALGVRPIMPRPYVQPSHVMPALPIRLPNLMTGVTCMAFSETCMNMED